MTNLKVEKWIIIHAFLLIFASIFCLWISSLGGIIFFIVPSLVGLLYLNRWELKRFTPYAGYANWLTFFRLSLLVIASCLHEDLSDEKLFLLLGIAVGLDGLDGWVARYFQQTSSVGALFDKEVDSFFVWSCAMLLYSRYDFSLWIIGIGLLHYLYEIVLFLLTWQYLKIPPNPVGKYIAAFLFLSLLTPILLPIHIAKWIVIIASICTLFSFSISLFFKYKASILHTE